MHEAAGGKPRLILIGTGSELQLCVAAAERLEAAGTPTRVVSLPSFERFEAQEQAYRASILPPTVRARVSVEAGVTFGWERWVGDAGALIGIDRFGASGPGGTILERLGFTVDHVTEVARRVAAGEALGRVVVHAGDHFDLGGAVRGH